MIDLGALRASITLDDSEATKKLKGFGDTTEEASGKLSGFLSKAGGMAKTAMIGLGGAIGTVAGAMGKVTAEALETTANIEKFSATCNISAEEFQKLDGVFKQVGWSMEGSAGDFAMLSEKMLEASQTGEGEAYEMFQKLGVAVEDNSGKLRNTGDVFNDMILSLQNVSDETERQAIASIMLGTTSEEIAPILKMTNEEFLKMKDNVNVIDEEQLKKAKEFKESWDRLKQTFETVVTEIGISLMPIFEELAGWLVENMPQIQAVIEFTFDVVAKVIGVVVDAVGGLIEWFENLFASNEELSAGLKVVWEAVSNMFNTVFKEISEFVSAFIGWCTKVWDKYSEDIISIATTLWELVKNIFGTAFDLLMESINFFTAFFKGDFEGMKEAITNITETLWQGIKDLFSAGLDFLRDLIPMMVDVGADLFNGLWDGIKSIWDGIASWIGEKVDWMMDKLMFWRDAGNEMSSGSKNIDGSHASGINYVPFDGYTAQLHKGERVLTAEQARNYSEISTSRMESLLEQLNMKLDRLPRNLAIENRF